MKARVIVPDLRHVNDLGYDEFEMGVLRVARYFIDGFQNPHNHAWQQAHSIAVERWGEAIGLPVAQSVLKILQALLRCRPEGVSFNDPFDPQSRNFASDDEFWLLGMLHNMRRDQTPAAREAVEVLTQGRMDPDVVRTGLAFAARFSCGAPAKPAQTRAPALRVV